jgi:hypothetical protein
MRKKSFNGISNDGGFENARPIFEAMVPKGNRSIPTNDEHALRKMI